MKIFETRTAPNPRRVRMFLAEKGMLENVDFIEVDIQGGENIQATFREKNPLAKIPVLELDNGQFISESVAICRYFEALQPEPSLMGNTALEQANIEMWQRRCEIYFLNQVGMGFQHSTGYFADRMTPVKEWGAECTKSAEDFLTLLENRLSESKFIAGDSFSIADITAFIAVDFARVIKVRPSEDMLNIKRWYEVINSRASARA